MEYIITFKTTNRAIKAEQCLLECDISVGVAPLPSQIKAGCGICLRIKPDQLEVALQILADNVDEYGLYSRAMQDGKYTYKGEEIK